MLAIVQIRTGQTSQEMNRAVGVGTWSATDCTHLAQKKVGRCHCYPSRWTLSVPPHKEATRRLLGSTWDVTFNWWFPKLTKDTHIWDIFRHRPSFYTRIPNWADLRSVQKSKHFYRRTHMTSFRVLALVSSILVHTGSCFYYWFHKNIRQRQKGMALFITGDLYWPSLS